MNLQEYQSYLFPVAIVGFFIWRFLKFKKVKTEMPSLIENGALVVDVRSPGEFQQGSRPGSINIPLNEISARSKELDKNRTVVLCCASGSRSGMAVGILKKNGFSKVINAGPWTNTLT
jgi:rhodanese-related sulfurtransferase